VSSAGLILAAGESRRMGFPKALLQYRGATFLDTLVELFAGRCQPVIVVLGAGAEEIGRQGLKLGSVTVVVNPDYGRGQTSSMQCGLRAVPPEAEGVLFTLVDHPAVTTQTVDALLGRGMAEHEKRWSAPLLRVPRYLGRRGHPIWFSRELIREFLAVPENGAARDVVARHRARTEFLDLDDPGIVADIDDPDAYRALTGVEA